MGVKSISSNRTNKDFFSDKKRHLENFFFTLHAENKRGLNSRPGRQGLSSYTTGRLHRGQTTSSQLPIHGVWCVVRSLCFYF